MFDIEGLITLVESRAFTIYKHYHFYTIECYREDISLYLYVPAIGTLYRWILIDKKSGGERIPGLSQRELRSLGAALEKLFGSPGDATSAKITKRVDDIVKQRLDEILAKK